MARVIIDGVSYAFRDPAEIDDNVESRSVAYFDIVDESAAFTFEVGNPVSVEKPSGTPIWKGVLLKPVCVRYGSLTVWEMTAVDWHYLADKRLVAASYLNQPAGTIVESIRSTYLAEEGVVVGNIETGPTVTTAVFNYVGADRAIGKLAELAGFTWWIDLDKRLYFQARESTAAPWQLSAQNMLDRAPTVDKSQPLYRNRQYVRGGFDKTELQTEHFAGDSERRTFTVGYPIAEVPTVTLNGGAQTVGILGIDSGKDWYWNKESKEIVQDSAGTVLVAVDDLQVDYIGLYPIVAVSEDLSLIAARAAAETSGSGKVEAIIDDRTLDEREQAFELAAAKILRNAVDSYTVKFETTRPGLAVGQLITVDGPLMGMPDGEKLLVANVQRKVWADHDEWKVTAVGGPVVEDWTFYIDQLADKADVFVVRDNITEDEILTIVTTYLEAWGWAETVVETVTACPVPAAGLFPATSLVPC